MAKKQKPNPKPKTTLPAAPTPIITPPVYVFGRPTKLSPEIAKILVDSARAGLVLAGCARRAGITKTTLDNWTRRGEKLAEEIENGIITTEAAVPREDRPYLDFFGALSRARGDREAEAHLDIRARRERWQSAAWWLETTMPLDYGRRWMRIEHSGPAGGPIESHNKNENVDGLSDEERVRRIKALLALVEEGEA